MVIMDVLHYIKDFFAQGLISRKRRAVDDLDSNIRSKMRRTSSTKMSSQEDCFNLLDDIVSNSSSSSIRRKSGLHNTASNARYKNLATKPDIATINLDEEDDDDVIIMTAKDYLNNGRRPTQKFTSTPNYSLKQNEAKDDDVTFLRVIEPSTENRQYYNKRNINSYSKPYQHAYTNGSTHNGTSSGLFQNESGSHDPTSPIYNTARPKQTPFRRFPKMHSPGYFPDKKTYEQLISSSSNSDSFVQSPFGAYSTPMGRLFSTSTNPSRGKKMLDLANKSYDKKPLDVIDLTNLPAAISKTSGKLSTKDTIKKVIDRYDNDFIVVNSDSCDVEILPTPPSPKPDFQVKRVNSLKTYVDPSEPQHEDWVSNLFRKHHEVAAKRAKEIDQQNTQRLKFNEINVELRKLKLDNDYKKCIRIKETLLPVELPEEGTVFPVLTDEQEDIVSEIVDKYGDEGDIFARKFNMNISRRDLKTLSGLSWLNDEVINFYMNLIMERGKLPKFPNVYAMNTFFYPKLLKDGHSSIKRWTRKVDIFAHHIIVVPIHLRMHWCMAIIDFRKQEINYYDSMGSPNRVCLDSLIKYLQEEHLDKKKCEYNTSKWSLTSVKDIPQQMNGSDCGMFSCTFAEFLTRDAKITFSQDDMPYLRRKMIVEIVQGRLLID